MDPAGSDICGEAARLRAQGPMSLVELPGGVTAWAITSGDLLRKLLTDPRVSKDPRQHWPAWINGEIPADWPLFAWVAIQSMTTAYGDERRRLRGVVTKAFTARRAAELRPRIEEITADLLHRVAAASQGGAVVDLREEFAYPLPIGVTGELLGLPVSRSAELRTITDGLFHTAADPAEFIATTTHACTLLGELVALKRQTPGGDLTSALIGVRDSEDNSPLSEQELLDTLLALVSGGYETTANLIDNAVCALLIDPEQRAHLAEGRASWDDVIEESLRKDAPAASVPLRYAVEDIAVGDTVIRKGEAILAGYAAAGREPRQSRPDADRFDVTRIDKEHLAFGYGAHHCPGASLARLEARIALPAIFERFPGLTLALPPGELRPVASFISNGHRTLPVRLH